ncbi:MAG: hypothetical protein HY926_08600 [Elusimicrobia bacterium]|nr:hypothetical protein [Elusimicrobiota bacterium]
MSPETKAWGLFCAAVFVWMGVSLLLAAPEHARSASAWMAAEGRPASEAGRRRLIFFYRLGGAFFAGFGLWMSWSAPLPSPELGRGGRLLGGAFFLLCGCLLAAVKAAAREARPAPESWGEKARRLWGWGLSLVFTAFGAYLLRSAGGHHV